LTGAASAYQIPERIAMTDSFAIPLDDGERLALLHDRAAISIGKT